jgi:hypothetical protein
MMISAPDVLVHTIGQALLDTLDASVLSDVVIQATPEFAASIWKAWDARADYTQKCRELCELARITEDDLEEVVDNVVRGLGMSPRDERTEGVFTYLSLLPATIRKRFRRPASPLGTALPTGFPLYGSWDLLPLLPPRIPKYQIGDRPWGIGDWELRELIEVQPGGEVWKAVNPRSTDRPPVALHFFTSATAKRCLRDHSAVVLDRLLVQGRVPGIVPLQQVHLLADPPCVQYPYLQTATLASLVHEWHETAATIDPIEVADLVLQIAQTLGRLHALQPAIVHRNLRAANILLMSDGARRRCLLADVGLALCCVEAAAIDRDSANDDDDADQAGDCGQPTSDVYALGVLWYQLLVGDLQRPRPGGSSWRRRLATRAMPAALIELLESCFDDDPASRPADGNALAAAIDQAGAMR